MVKPVSNPPNPWDSTYVEWLGEPPEAKLEIFEEEPRSILAENESPDVGFRWSLNPYRGCFHACAYCAAPETSVLMADGQSKALADLRVGDRIYGTTFSRTGRRLIPTLVLNQWSRRASAFRVRLKDGRNLVASGKHRLLTTEGWRNVAQADTRYRNR